MDPKFTFFFEYIGGGFFRKRNVPKGEKAQIVHGDDIILRALSEFLHHLSVIGLLNSKPEGS